MSIDEAYLQKLMRTISHDMGGTLRVAVGFSKLLLENYEAQLDEKATKWLSLIKEDGEKTQEKLIALSRYARLYDIPDNPTACDLAVLCDKAVYASGLEEFYSGISVQIESLPVIEGYERLWVDIFAELVGNVAKHAGGAPSIFCIVDAQEQADTLIIRVRDNGVGLTDKQKEMALLPFRVVESVGKVGVGMGLPMVKRMVELQGGTLALEDNQYDDKGLQVVIRLPTKAVTDRDSI